MAIFHGKINYFDWAIFNSYVKVPEGKYGREAASEAGKEKKNTENHWISGKGSGKVGRILWESNMVAARIG